MNYTEAMEKIDSLLVFGSQPGLERISALLELMGNPQDKVRYVHVAGTNGKGSVCNMLSCVLGESGLKTGLFTSPHITGFGERIQINGEMMPESGVIEEVERLFPYVARLRESGVIITEFEFVTAMAFDWFARMNCDIVVLETGMGGRFDATNVIKKPLCSIITSISLDHTAVLGDTLGKIAFEKCGIIKPDSRTVFALQQSEVNECVIKTAKERNNVLTFAPKLTALESSLDGTVVMYEGRRIHLPLLGEHQLLNLSLVLTALDALWLEGIRIDSEVVSRGICKVRLPARFEMLSREPLVIADGAHNPDGMKALSNAVKKYLADRDLICVIGMLRDKDCSEAVSFLRGLTKRMITTTIPDNPRRQTAAELLATVTQQGIAAVSCEDPEKAVKLAFEMAKNEQDPAILICGSLYLVSMLREVAKDTAGGIVK